MFPEISKGFYSLAQWNEWVQALPFLREKSYIDDMAESIAATGFVDPLDGFVSPEDITIDRNNYRESFAARGSTSRYRALLSLLLDHVLLHGWCSPIYLGEDLTAFSDLLSGRFPYLVKSAALDNPLLRMKMPKVRHEDPLNLSLPDRSFDVYVAPDIMIYASSMELFLREARRVLRRTGVLLATFPFRYGEPDSLILAEKKPDGTIVHLADPIFNVNPISGARTRRVYFVPAWDVLQIALDIGFQTAEIVVQSSRTHAILGAEIAAVFSLRATA